jgi:hypothetical protein
MAQQVVDHPQLTALDVFLLGLTVTHGEEHVLVDGDQEGLGGDPA